jgi:hypothetical protein
MTAAGSRWRAWLSMQQAAAATAVEYELGLRAAYSTPSAVPDISRASSAPRLSGGPGLQTRSRRTWRARTSYASWCGRGSRATWRTRCVSRFTDRPRHGGPGASYTYPKELPSPCVEISAGGELLCAWPSSQRGPKITQIALSQPPLPAAGGRRRGRRQPAGWCGRRSAAAPHCARRAQPALLSARGGACC